MVGQGPHPMDRASSAGGAESKNGTRIEFRWRQGPKPGQGSSAGRPVPEGRARVKLLVGQGPPYELQDSIEQPARWRAQSGRFCACGSAPDCSS